MSPVSSVKENIVRGGDKHWATLQNHDKQVESDTDRESDLWRQTHRWIIRNVDGQMDTD
jgi:hypothetical protein